MRARLIALTIFPLASTVTFAQPAATQTQMQTQDKGADSTQSFTSALGFGTAATLSVTSKGTSVVASVERQMDSPAINFWQVAFSGTTDKNGQTQLFSSSDKDAPGFKGKFGIGKSSFIRKWLGYTASAGLIVREAMCRDLLDPVNKSLAHPVDIPDDAVCTTALDVVKSIYAKAPPSDAAAKKADDLILDQLTDKVNRLMTEEQQVPDKVPDPILAENEMCQAFEKTLGKDSAAYKLCPGSGGTIHSPEDIKKKYPALYTLIAPPKPFQWKVWGSWAPTVTSVDYRASSNGVTDLADKHQWTQLLNSGLGDIALYEGRFALGLEGGFGQTVQVTTQNVCNTMTSGTYTSQSCDMAMIGKPNPTNAWMASSALQVYPIPVLGKNTQFNPGLQVNLSYVAPTTGGHSSELSIPFYLAPSAKPMTFVVGIQPTWDWNTNPKIGNKFTVALFVGARPEITK